MSAAEIQKTRMDLIEWISHLDNIDLLLLLENVRTSADNDDWWDSLSEIQRLHINEGLNDVATGRTMSSEDFWSRLKNG